jgi:hypothetical protein
MVAFERPKMKLLSLDPIYRIWLNKKSALTFDSNLNEMFLGLTHDESIFFAYISSVALRPGMSWETGDVETFLRLHQRHELSLNYKSALDKFMLP